MGKIRLVILMSFLLVSCHKNYCQKGSNKLVGMISLPDNANLNIFTWDEALCDYIGMYDSTKVTPIQLKNTLDLFASTDRFYLDYNVTPWQIREIDGLNVDSLENEYKKKFYDLQSLEIIKSSFWKKYKKDKIKELNQVYKYKKITLLAFNNPDTLRSINYPKECSIYVNALIEGNQLLLKVWDKLNKDACKVNADPIRLRRIFEREYASTDKLKYARIEVMSFGWWNHINNLIFYLDKNKCHDRFIKSFIAVNEECEDP